MQAINRSLGIKSCSNYLAIGSVKTDSLSVSFIRDFSGFLSMISVEILIVGIFLPRWHENLSDSFHYKLSRNVSIILQLNGTPYFAKSIISLLFIIATTIMIQNILFVSITLSCFVDRLKWSDYLPEVSHACLSDVAKLMAASLLTVTRVIRQITLVINAKATIRENSWIDSVICVTSLV